MAFTTALYYPWIDITNEAWMKSAMLYWESIRTIVPVAIDNPYSTRTAKALQEAGILTPLRVNSSMEEIEGLTDDIQKYLRTQEAAEFFTADRMSRYGRIHANKIPSNFERLSRLHPQKLPYEIRHLLEQSGLLGGREGDWYRVDARFAGFYMTLLATKLSDRIGAGLLTDASQNNKLAFSAKVDSRLNPLPRDRHRHEYQLLRRGRVARSTLAQGMLADLIIEKIKINPRTSITKLLKFREDNAAALGKFRSEIGNLTQSISSDVPIEQLQQTVSDIYQNEVYPATQEIKEGLSALGIKWFADNYLKVAFLSTSTTSTMSILGLNVPQALLVGSGISLTASAILYNLDKRQSLRKNPFAYVLAAERKLR